MSKALRTVLFAGMAVLSASGSTSSGSAGSRSTGHASLPSDDAAATTTPLSLMTYNLAGLPWPIAAGRRNALAAIAARLGDLRRVGRQPHIVLLQEAFTPEARAIASNAGYRHAAFGPDETVARAGAVAYDDRAYLAAGRWDRGEQWGKWLGSGLIILSDYPIVRIDRFAFPDAACAGFDCLANKGAVIAHLRVPGFAAPVAVVDTHLNARKAAGVPIARSHRAYARQADLLARFIGNHVRPGQALMIGGDMNIGSDVARARAFFAAFDEAGLDFVTPESGGIQAALGRPTLSDPRSRRDLSAAGARRKDWVFARRETGATMAVAQAHVPFGTERGGAALSDHVGYVIDYAPPEPIALASNDPALPAMGPGR